MRYRKRSRRAGRRGRRIWRAVYRLALVVLVPVVSLVVVLRFVNPPYTAFMGLAALDAWRRGAVMEIDHDWLDYGSIPRATKLAVIAAEDQRFARHWGFDLNQIQDALADAQDGGRLRGASTLSQQTAKNLFLWPGHSWIRKGLEAGLTVLIETFWSKRRILEVYLNVAELGEGVYGVEAAARRYFGKSARHLSRAESALLAAVLPSPRRLHVNDPSPYVRSRQAWILGQMERVARLDGVSGLLRGDPG